jgi:hypothetical protein
MIRAKSEVAFFQQVSERVEDFVENEIINNQVVCHIPLLSSKID